MEFLFPVRVYYEDTDAGGVVYHAKYLNYFERARTEALRTLGFEQDVLLREDDTVFVVRYVQIDYLQPARFNDEVVVNTQIEQLKKTSIVFIQTLSRSNDARLLCRMTVKVACLSASRFKPKAIPEAISARMEVPRAS